MNVWGEAMHMADADVTVAEGFGIAMEWKPPQFWKG